MKLIDLSRSDGIGASCLWVELGPFRLLIDAGIDPKGVGLEATPRFEAAPYGDVDAIILTHCHLDHLGSMPLASARYPGAPVLCSRASETIAPRMLRNSANVMKRQREELSIREYPLYGRKGIGQFEDRLRGLEYRRPMVFEKAGEELSVTLFRAGHIVGAVGVLLTYKRRQIFFTGDVLFGPQRTLPGADFPDHELDTLVMETTRGSTERAPNTSRATEVERLIEDLASTLSAGGSVLLPVFALGRMQEMISVLGDARQARRLPRVPVYCSGLGLALVDYFDAIARKHRAVDFRRGDLARLGVTDPPGDYKPGRDLGRAAIHLLSSGMMVEHTPSYLAATGLIGRPQNRVCFVGYCDPATPGGVLQTTARGERFSFAQLDFEMELRAEVSRYDLSGHADRAELIDFALRADPRAVVLVHGDPSSREWFAGELHERLPKAQVVTQVPGRTYEH